MSWPHAHACPCMPSISTVNLPCLATPLILSKAKHAHHALCSTHRYLCLFIAPFHPLKGRDANHVLCASQSQSSNDPFTCTRAYHIMDVPQVPVRISIVITLRELRPVAGPGIKMVSCLEQVLSAHQDKCGVCVACKKTDFCTR